MIEDRIYRSKQRRLRELRRNTAIFIIVTVSIIFTLSISLSSILSSAHEDDETVYYKYYTNIEIEAGDTLWSIAEIYYDSHYKNMDELIDEIMFINTMEDDTIIQGHHIIVPYYSSEFIYK
ncbi:MAG: hypothetical protein R3Y24_13220 [Eubacteriales bacterium]